MVEFAPLLSSLACQDKSRRDIIPSLPISRPDLARRLCCALPLSLFSLRLRPTSDRVQAAEPTPLTQSLETPNRARPEPVDSAGFDLPPVRRFA